MTFSAIPRDAIFHPSPNFGPRRRGAIPDLIVLHYTGMEDAESALNRLCDSAAEVSAHYMICEDGGILQLVDEKMRAWHAGAGKWGEVEDVNSLSFGIELANTGFHPFPEPQMSSLETLLEYLMSRWKVPPERVIAHSDMAPSRKFDPGPRFDWLRLSRRGLSIWPVRRDAKSGFMTLARAFGYTADVGESDILAAFRLRFRPWAHGPAELEDMELLADLAARFPVD